MNDLWKFDGANWTWVGGSDTSASIGGVHGSRGVPGASNYPGWHSSAASWIDNSGNMFLFGFGEVWRFDGSLWTWEGGASNEAPFWVQIAVPDLLNTPGSRNFAAWWVANNTFYGFGGNRQSCKLLLG